MPALARLCTRSYTPMPASRANHEWRSAKTDRREALAAENAKTSRPAAQHAGDTGGGLCLKVAAVNTKSWVLRYMINARPRSESGSGRCGKAGRKWQMVNETAATFARRSRPLSTARTARHWTLESNAKY